LQQRAIHASEGRRYCLTVGSEFDPTALSDQELKDRIDVQTHVNKTTATPPTRTHRPFGTLVRVVIGALAILLIVIGGRYLLLPRADSVAAASYFLDGPRRFTFRHETGTPVAHCRAAPLLGFFSTTLHCTLTYPSGDVYRCKVFTTRTVGTGASCDTQHFRRSQHS
jgi:hypothetical protein